MFRSLTGFGPKQTFIRGKKIVPMKKMYGSDFGSLQFVMKVFRKKCDVLQLQLTLFRCVASTFFRLADQQTNK